MRKRVGGEFVKGLGELGDSLLVFTDVALLEEGLVRQPFGLVIGLPVHGGAVGQQLQGAGEILLLAGVLFVVVLQLPVDVREPCTDPILVPLECVEVDGVGEVRSQELLALGLEALEGRGQLACYRSGASSPAAGPSPVVVGVCRKWDSRSVEGEHRGCVSYGIGSDNASEVEHRLDEFRGHDLAGRPFGNDSSVAHRDEVIGVACGVIQFVKYGDDGSAGSTQVSVRSGALRAGSAAVSLGLSGGTPGE